MYIRHQTIPYLADLNVDFMEAFVAVCSEHGIHAARCFCLGS